MTRSEIFQALQDTAKASRDLTLLGVAIDRILELNERIAQLEKKNAPDTRAEGLDLEQSSIASNDRTSTSA